MKKKTLLLASMGVLACTVGVATLAVNGINQLNNLQVKAETKDYSITFDAGSHVGEVAGGNYAIGTTTAGGAKVGVVGCDKSESFITFKGASFVSLCLYDYEGVLWGVGVWQFSYITGFAISFSGGNMMFRGGDTEFIPVVDGHEYTELSITPNDEPEFMTIEEDSVTVTSLTIWYSCENL